MRILVGCSSPPDAGAGILTYSKEITEALIALGHTVYFAAPPAQNDRWARECGVELIATDPDGDPPTVVTMLLRAVSERKVEGIINNDNPFVQSIAPAVSTPVVSVGHLGQGAIGSLACWPRTWLDYVVAISNDMQKTFVLQHGIPVARCPIIHNGIRDPGEEVVGCGGAEDRPVRAIFIGGYNRLKGGRRVLRMALADPAVWKGIELAWYGRLPEWVSAKLSGCPHVLIKGHVKREEIILALRNSDILLFPSQVEGCPMAMLEAMSLGVPVIASDGIGAMRWLVESGGSGYICHLRSWEKQALECLRHLRVNPRLLGTMSREARGRYLNCYQSDRVAGRLVDLLQVPTVDRSALPDRIEILRWHRPPRRGSRKASLLGRARYRLGLLPRAGLLPRSGADMIRNW